MDIRTINKLLLIGMLSLSVTSHATIYKLVIESTIAGTLAHQIPDAPFSIGDPVTFTLIFDSNAQSYTPNSSPAAYEFISLTSTWGSYSIYSEGSPYGPVGSISSGIYIWESDEFDHLRILDQSDQTGGGMIADDIGNYSLDYLEFDFIDPQGLALDTAAPPVSLDLSAFEWIDGSITFQGNGGFATVFLDGFNITATISEVPVPVALWCMISALAFFGFCKKPQH